MQARSGEELALIALRKESQRLWVLVERARADVDEYIHAGTEALKIHEEFRAIVASKETGPDVVARLGALSKRQRRVERVLKKDLLALTDKQCVAELEHSNLRGQISLIEFHLSRKRA